VASSNALTPGSGAAFVFLQSAPGCAAGGGYGNGNAWPAATAAHELIHLLSDRNMPNGCPGDTAHVCDSGADIMAVERTNPFLSLALLDAGRDDYYGHGDPLRRDVRDSAWLSHLDETVSPVSVAISASGEGRVSSTVSGIECPPRCNTTFDSNDVLFVSAEPAPGYVFRQWAGDCQGVLATCSVHLDGAPKALVAQFVPLVRIEVRVIGNGSVSSGGLSCQGRCDWERPLWSDLQVVALPSPEVAFVKWSGSCDGEGKRCKTEVKRKTTVTAKFAKRCCTSTRPSRNKMRS
jgi:Divergent InlB B-repeat domain